MKAIVPMLVMVVTVFILCWTPILIFEVTFHFPANDLKNILQVLQAFDVIGLQVFGLVKHIKTFCSLLAYVNRLKLQPEVSLSLNQCYVSVVSILLYTVLCQKTSDGVSPRHCVNVKTKKSSTSPTKNGRHLCILIFLRLINLF